jgi:hypothetical protein
MPTTDHRHIDIGPHRHVRDEHSKDEHSKQLTDADDSGGVGRPSSVGPYDREISLRGILGSGIVLVVVTVISALLMWWMLRAFAASDQRKDPPASPIPAARQQPLPPEPRLQVNDKEDMRGLRGREDAILNEPAWVDQGQGTARIPIGVGMEAIVGRGLAPIGGGTPAASQQDNAGQAPGALNQMARPVSPAAPPPPNPGAGQPGPSSPPQQ